MIGSAQYAYETAKNPVSIHSVLSLTLNLSNTLSSYLSYHELTRNVPNVTFPKMEELFSNLSLL